MLAIPFFLLFHIQAPAWRTEEKVLIPLRWVRVGICLPKSSYLKPASALNSPLDEWMLLRTQNPHWQLLLCLSHQRNSSTTARWDSAKLVRPGVLQGIAELLAQGVSRHLAPIKQKMWCFKQEDNFCHQVDLKDRFALSLLTFQHEGPCMDEGPIVEMSMAMPCIHSQPTPTLTRIFYAHTDGKCHEASWCVTRMGICRSSYAGAQRPITRQPCRQTRLKRRLQQKSWK